ncbi:uncharacterized protein [Argopecten irradians]|uniref:uncharacterized protein n=1 Tax=Argopecten irradians TaxID=31199 RepID=UPI003715AC43
MSIRHFHHYLYGVKFTVRTDHGALNWLLRFKSPESQMTRWLEILGTYNMDVQQRPGRQHGNTDVCVMPSLTNSSINIESRKVYMINACPYDTENETLQIKCQTNNIVFKTDHIEFPPVTSRQYKQTFKNKFCAECNGVYDYLAWSLSVDCQTLTDFNFFSTYDDILDTAESEGCNIGFDTVADDVLECKADFVEEIIFSECNKTGTWTTYNSDIELACHSVYRMNASVYRNVYCLMCNPPISNGDIISSCNVTGLWDEKVEPIEQACRVHALSVNTVPYKNIFCFLCNRNSSHSAPYYDVYIDKMSEGLYVNDVSGPEKYVYRYTFSFNEYNLGFHETIIASASNGRGVEPTKEYSLAINLSRLLQYDFSVTGYYRYCRQDVVPYTFEKYNCSCDLRCVFDPMVECCLDVVLESSISCQMPYLATEGSCYYFIDGCSRSAWPDIIQSRCRSPGEDIYSTLSVVAEGDVLYKNFDCFLCNQNFDIFSTQSISQSKYLPWSISVRCEGDLNIRFHSTIYSIIEIATRSGCNIYLPTDLVSQVETCVQHSGLGPYIGKCNTTGYWREYDSDIVWSCEQSSLVNPYAEYRNVFCFLCNPSVKTTLEAFQNCTNDRSSQHGAQNSHACQELPVVTSMFPMKNVFCHYCNTNISDIPLPPMIMFEMLTIMFRIMLLRDPDIKANFRNLFGLIATKIVKKGQELNGTHLFDPMTTRHRRLTCYPGKVLNGTECRPLLRTTTNLKYTLALSLEGTIPSVNKTNIVLGNIRNVVYSEMTTRLDIGFTIVMFWFTSNVSCEKSNVTLPIAAHLLIQTTVTITEVVERINIERILLKMSKDDLMISGVMFRQRPAIEAYMLPTVIGSNFGGYCVKSMFFDTNESLALPDLRTTLVSDVMICRQVTLDAGEFSINPTTLELYVKYTSKRFTMDKFMRMSDGKTRLCLDDYLAIINEHETSNENNTMEDALYITTMVCTVISLICLFLTFCTYMFFRTMRSIPGVTNMSLVFAMFFSQGLFHVGFNQTSNVPVCIAIGMVSHYFWLATFTCMNVCSYHMYIVFGSNMLLVRSNNSRKTLAIYFSYSYGIPALFVLANTMTSFSMSVSDGVTSDLTTIGYGGRVCFISKSVSMYATFLAPVVLICFLNMFMFTKMAIQMKALPEVESTKAHKHDFVIYLKLFSITGITWILVIIDTFLPLSVYSFIVSILNGCQGLFIFFSFICNQNVFSLYRKMCCKTKRRQASPIDFPANRVDRMSTPI